MPARSHWPLFLLAALSLVLGACEFPALVQEPGDSLATQAAETIGALRTQEAAAGFPTQAPTTQPPLGTEAPSTSPTEAPAATESPTVPPTEEPSADCTDEALFIDDVTYPDGAEVETGESFEKTWRLENIGTCTWTTDYEIVFDEGDKMSGPTSASLPESVSPGEEVDLSVDLIAPDDPGSYQGFWRLRNADGALFGVGEDSEDSFWVEVEVLEPGPRTATLNRVVSESGSVRSDSEVWEGVLNVGDDADNDGAQVFAAFDISDIPAGANIDIVQVNFSDFNTLGDPFDDLGCLRAYRHDYGTMGPGDYFTASPSDPIGQWCDSDELETVETNNDIEAAMEDELGENWFKIRLQFNETETDNDGAADMVRFGNLRLVITYITN